MNKKLVGIFFILVLVVVGMYAWNSYTPDGTSSVAKITSNTIATSEESELRRKAIDVGASKFEFEGFSVAKSHVGTFDSWSGEISLSGESISGVEVLIDASSVNTGIEKLDSHLKSDDFFEIANYPEIKFSSSSLTDDTISGVLEFRGVSKNIEFPAKIEGNKLSADFLLDTTPFNMKYAGVNKEVRIAFDIVA